MLVETLLRRLVVVGRHQQAGIRPGLLGFLCLVDGLGGGVAARAGDDRHLAGHHADGSLDDREVFPGGERRRLAGGAHGHDAVGAAVEMPGDQAVERLPIHRPGGCHRGNQRHYAAAQHRLKLPLNIGRIARAS